MDACRSCMCAGTCVCMHVCTCMYVGACMCGCMYVIHVYAGVYVCMCIVCRCMWGCLVQVYVCAGACGYEYTCVHDVCMVVSVCMMCVWVYVCAGACGCRCIRRPDDNLCRSPGAVHLVFERGSFTEPRLSRLADEPQGSTSPSAVSASPAPGPQAYTTMAGISMWALGTKLRHSCLHDKHLTG